ncbi:Flp pilus assembly protein CpaB [Trinickia dabaoshanensis]|uniref:Flp pilus assembly protein CpaB n=1 Tax=Trinickia dabaoshanensis TaxID=564714 RepID=A0A2N7VDX7_9BURK|nr:Flp pilus assembly protein CpaB [Trinickia dabaoshanensis]PMS15345.1 Flp pilus assembly protein CpaB [Trinickia dabaoshanensis]
MSSTVKLALLVGVAIVAALILRMLFIAASAHTSSASVQRVRIAASDLPPGLLLRDSDLAWKDMSSGRAPVGAVLQNDPATPDVAGAVVLHAVTAGAIVTSRDVVFPNAPGFLAAALKPDMRAISVAIDDVSGNAGLIQPGDYVDLILTQNLNGKTDSPRLSVSSETVVNHVRVLAVGSEFTRPKGDTTQGGTAHARTVTLEVDPRTAEVVAIAARLGTLSLALRSFATLVHSTPGAQPPAEATPENTPPIWAGDVSRAVRALPAIEKGGMPRAPQAPAVLVYRGSSKSDQEAEVSPAQAGAAPYAAPAPSAPGLPPIASPAGPSASNP